MLKKTSWLVPNLMRNFFTLNSNFRFVTISGVWTYHKSHFRSIISCGLHTFFFLAMNKNHLLVYVICRSTLRRRIIDVIEKSFAKCVCVWFVFVFFTCKNHTAGLWLSVDCQSHVFTNKKVYVYFKTAFVVEKTFFLSLFQKTYGKIFTWPSTHPRKILSWMKSVRGTVRKSFTGIFSSPFALQTTFALDLSIHAVKSAFPFLPRQQQ